MEDLVRSLEEAEAAGEKRAVAPATEELKVISTKGWYNPWRRAPLGDTVKRVLYFALVWPEVAHQLESGLVKTAVRATTYLTTRTGASESPGAE